MAALSDSPRIRGLDPATPMHSPHHSVNSSVSSRLSFRNLTLHEYRKQQNSPASQATPPGKPLRRKAAASGLNTAERVPSVSRTPLFASRAPPHLQFPQSSRQVFTYQLPPSPPHQQHDWSPDEISRSQSVESTWSYNSADKVRKFKPIKRLPKPLSISGRGGYPSAPIPPLASVTSNRKQPHLSPLRTASFPSFVNSTSNDSQTTPSTFSLSRFPQPPNLVDPPQSPVSDEDNPPPLNTTSYASTAPATPPATPAVIHYRGASFDLVNPHRSLVLENIVTPSRDFESSEYLPLRSSEEPFEFSEMAPKRALYGDLNSAHASITRRTDENPPSPNLSLPIPPTPAALSPASTSFSSPLQSPESDVFSSNSPPARKPEGESRFSLKHLSRSLTQKFKHSEKGHESELQEFSESRVSPATPTFDGEFPRPLDQTYRTIAPKSSLSDEPSSPVSPLDQAVHFRDQRAPLLPAGQSRPRSSVPRSQSAPFSSPLASMVPDYPSADLSAELGRASGPRPYASEGDFSTRPYADDLESVYASSSVYTSDEHRRSRIAPTVSSNRNSNAYWGVSETGGADALANEYQSDAVPQYPSSRRTSQRVSRTLEQDMFQRSMRQGMEKADTITRFIDQYKSSESLISSQPLLSDTGLQASPPKDLDETAPTRITSGLSQFQFGLAGEGAGSSDERSLLSMDAGHAGKSALTRNPGLPPSVPAPLAPPFEYDDYLSSAKRSDPSGLSSNSPSYGDTRNLLQLSQLTVGDYCSTPPFQPSSPSGPTTPKEALEQAERIFAQAASQKQTEDDSDQTGDIPAMWSRRVSSHMQNRSLNDFEQSQEEQDQRSSELAGFEDPQEASELAGYEDESEHDWETEQHASPHHGIHESIGESLAGYSTSEGTHSSRDSWGFSGQFPVYEDPALEPGEFQYRHPTPLRTHSNPFTSSPPSLRAGSSMPGMSYHAPQTPVPSSPPVSTTVPAFHGSSSNAYSSSPRQEFLPITPWFTPYALSERETQELLESGPNEEILYEGEREEDEDQEGSSETQDGSSPMQPMRISIPTMVTLEGGAASDVLSKASVTGTPHGTGMKDAGSSVADSSSPGAMSTPANPSSASSPSFGHRSGRHGFKSFASVYGNAPGPYHPAFTSPDASSESSGFYSGGERRGSVNRITPRLHTPPDSKERTPSQATLFPREGPMLDPTRPAARANSPFGDLIRQADRMQESVFGGSVREGKRSVESPSAGPSHQASCSQESPFPEPVRHLSRMSLQTPVTPPGPRRGRGAAVRGQTKLRNMVLASSLRTQSSSDPSVDDSRILGGAYADSPRPSTSNTNTPLRATFNRTNEGRMVARRHSPRLLCPERALDPGEEAIRRQVSWIIFAGFCLMPPLIILYRYMGDNVIFHLTDGRFSQVSVRPKRLAVVVGITVNVGLVVFILVPILVMHAAGRI